MNKWLTPKEVAEILNVSRAYVDYLIKGRIRKTKNNVYTTLPVFTKVQQFECKVHSHYLVYFKELEKMR
jgi:hypothetical protein